MRRVIAIALCMLICAGAQCADWASVSTGDGNQHYYDRSKVFASGEEVTYWRRVVFATPHPVKNGFARSAQYRERIQCKQHRIAMLGYLLYASDGSVLENVYTPDAEATAIVPETVGERFQRVMCAVATGAPTDTPPPPAAPAPPKEAAPKKPEGNEEIKQEIDRLENMLKRLRERVGERQN